MGFCPQVFPPEVLSSFTTGIQSLKCSPTWSQNSNSVSSHTRGRSPLAPLLPISSTPPQAHGQLQKTERWVIQNTLGKTHWMSHAKRTSVRPVTWMWESPVLTSLRAGPSSAGSRFNCQLRMPLPGNGRSLMGWGGQDATLSYLVCPSTQKLVFT